MHIIIAGGGVVGVSTAYHLAQKAKDRDLKITIIEQTAIACAASGKAGGFLALDWSKGTALDKLSRESFKLHAKLAEENDGSSSFDYRKVDTYSVQFGPENSNNTSKQSPLVPWVSIDRVTDVHSLGTCKTTAQVHPKLFTKALLAKAILSGKVNVIEGKGVAKLLYDKEDQKMVTGVELEDGETMVADEVVLCMGPWTGQLPLMGRRRDRLPIEGSRAHSIVMKPTAPIPAQLLFTDIETEVESSAPEVYPRPDGTVYLCGMSDDEPLPPREPEVKVDPKAISRLEQSARIVSPHLPGTIQARQACYLPISGDGRPFIGRHPSLSHLSIASGHSCWGILLAPITGLVIAELLLDGDITCVDRKAVSAVDPANRI